MKFIYKTLFFCTILVSVSACVFNPRPLDVDIDEVPQKLVISSLSLPPQQLVVSVTRTFSALLGEDSVNIDDPDIASRILVDSALVILQYAGGTDTLFKLAPGIYGSLNADQLTGEKYSLYVKDYLTGEVVTAETTFLPTVPIDTAFETISNLLGDTLFNIETRFYDPVSTQNYYLTTYTNINQLRATLTGVAGNVFNFSSAQFSVFSDKNYGDSTYIKFKPTLPPGFEGDTIVVGLSNISEEYYNFLAAYKRSGNLFTQLIAEPISLPTNVVGGYGYFAMTKPSLRLVILR